MSAHGIPALVVGSWGSWFLLLVSCWSTADWYVL
jgi:hypothetical protein